MIKVNIIMGFVRLCFVAAVTLGVLLRTVTLASQLFSPELCCGETPLRADDHRRCCGNASYSPYESMCCWETSRGHYVLGLPTSPLNGTANLNSILGAAAANRFLACCGERVYDFRFYTCCDGVIRKQGATGNTGCCGSLVYDPYIQLCCDETILPKSGFGSFCCGARAYDQTKQVCCGGKVHDAVAATEGLGCCGDATYDTAAELCCAGRRLPKATANSYCCGDDQFDWESESCCDGDVFTKTSESEFCCGAKPYDTATHLCCLDSVIPRKKRPDALKRPLTPSKRFHTLPVDDGGVLCCGNVTYDFDREICCQGRVTPRGGAGVRWKCCGSRPYDEEEEICCQGRVVAKAARAEDCCGARVFDVQKQVCCQGVIHPLNPDALLYCCGNSTFDPETEACCRGKKTLRQTRLGDA